MALNMKPRPLIDIDFLHLFSFMLLFLYVLCTTYSLHIRTPLNLEFTGIESRITTAYPEF